MAISTPQVRGYLLEEALAWLMRHSGYDLLVDASQDPDELLMHGSELRVNGRGTSHQVDVLGEFAFTPAFSLPEEALAQRAYVGGNRNRQVDRGLSAECMVDWVEFRAGRAPPGGRWDCGPSRTTSKRHGSTATA